MIVVIVVADSSSVGGSTFQSCHVLTTVQKPADMKPIFDNIANDDDDDYDDSGNSDSNDDDTLNIA